MGFGSCIEKSFHPKVSISAEALIDFTWLTFATGGTFRELLLARPSLIGDASQLIL